MKKTVEVTGYSTTKHNSTLLMPSVYSTVPFFLNPNTHRWKERASKYLSSMAAGTNTVRSPGRQKILALWYKHTLGPITHSLQREEKGDGKKESERIDGGKCYSVSKMAKISAAAIGLELNLSLFNTSLSRSC